MFNNLIGKNKELGRFLFCERYTLPPVKNAMYIAEGQDLKRGAVVDVNGVLVGTNSLMPYAVLEFDCDTRDGGKEASVFIKGEFNFDKLSFASGLSKSDLDNIVYNGSGLGIVIKPYEYEKEFSPLMVPAGMSEENPLMTAADTERMVIDNKTPAANTIRFSFSKLDYEPTLSHVGSSGTWNKISKYEGNNIWEWTKSGTSFISAFYRAFRDASNFVTIIAVGDTSEVTDMSSLFTDCTSLKNVPLFDTSSVTNTNNMFNGCTNVEGGAIELYQQASKQATPPATHFNMFTNCGINTTIGAANLAKIPMSWGGLAAG